MIDSRLITQLERFIRESGFTCEKFIVEIDNFGYATITDIKGSPTIEDLECTISDLSATNCLLNDQVETLESRIEYLQEEIQQIYENEYDLMYNNFDCEDE